MRAEVPETISRCAARLGIVVMGKERNGIAMLAGPLFDSLRGMGHG
jgi:hypothetical protein